MKAFCTFIFICLFNLTLLSQTSDSVATGHSHSLAVNSDGSLWVWGDNTNGQLGTGNTNSISNPLQNGTDTNWQSVSAGYNHSFAIKNDGTLWAWGENNVGQLGEGTTTQNLSPVQVGTDNNWESISTGGGHTLALKTDDTLWVWGSDSWGQLGSNNSNSLVPIQMGTGNDWVDIATTVSSSFAIKSDGTIWSWGRAGASSDSVLGYGSAFDAISNPQQIGSDNDWSTVEGGYSHVIAKKTNGTIYSWGRNSHGQIGVGSNEHVTVPTQIGTSSDWNTIKTGDYTSYGIKNNGLLYCWGENGFGQVSPSVSDNEITTPVLFNGNNDWTTASGGETHSIVKKDNGTLWLFGNNYVGQLGVDTFVGDIPNPLNINISSSANSVSAGTSHSGFTTTDGNLSYFGFTFSAIPAFSSNINDTNIPTPINGNNDWQSISFGSSNLAIKNNGTMWRWGYNQESLVPLTIPVQVGTDTNWSRVYASGINYAIKNDGSLWGWGEGYIGNGEYETVSAPIQVGTDTNWVKIAQGLGGHILGIKADGTLWTWGINEDGSLGNGSVFTQHQSPTMIGTDTDWIDIGVGDSRSLALKNDGTLWGWGRLNIDIGGIFVTRALVPTQISFDNDWGRVAKTRGNFSFIIKNDFTLWGWGGNTYGELGNGTFVGTNEIMQVGSDSDWFDVQGGLEHTIAQKLNGEVWTWGRNERGQLGMGNGIVVIDVNALSVNDVEQRDYIAYLYPNPSNGIVTISRERNYDSIELFTLLGNKIDITIANGTFNIENLENGIYLVKLIYKGNISTLRLIKK